MTTLWDKEGAALRLSRGFVAPTPMVLRGTRVMVDWALLLKEAKGEQEMGRAGQESE